MENPNTMPKNPYCPRWKESVFAIIFCVCFFAALPAEAQGPPTAPEIEKLFQFEPGAQLKEEDTRDARRPDLWARRYSNTDTSYYSVSITVCKHGMVLTDDYKKQIAEIIRFHNTDKESRRLESIGLEAGEAYPAQLHHPTFFTFRTKDKRFGYNYSLATLGGLGEITVLPSKNGKSDLIIVLDYTPPHDMPEPERKRASRPKKSASEILEALELALEKNTNRPTRLKPEDPNGYEGPAAPDEPATE